MKKISIICILLVVIMVILGCASPASTLPASTAPESSPQTISAESCASVTPTNFKYIVAQEAGKYYLHKIKSWSTDGNIITFKCLICGNTIRIPESNVIMYEKVTIKSAWQADVSVCGGTTSDWKDLLVK